MKTARNSSGSPYECKAAWPEEVFVQCGGDGIVLTSARSISEAMGDVAKAQEIIAAVAGVDNESVSYRTAFFEAFPKDPSCFIRGEGKTIEDAEADAFSQYTEIKKCSHKEFDRRGRVDGYAFCKNCPYSSTVLDPLTNCTTCGVPAHYSQDKNGNWYCESDYFKLDVDVAIGVSEENEENSSLFSVASSRRRFLRGKVRTEVMESMFFTVGTKAYEEVSRRLSARHSRIEVSNIFKKEDKISTEEIQAQFTDEVFIEKTIREIIADITKQGKS